MKSTSFVQLKIFFERISFDTSYFNNYTPTSTDRVVQNDLLPYIKDILGGKRFFALHPREPRILGPLYNEDIEQFYSQHHDIELEREMFMFYFKMMTSA